MVEAGLVVSGTKVVSHGFEGLEQLEPTDEVVYDIKDLNRAMDELNISNNGNARLQILKQLECLGLDKLKTTSTKLPKILKLLGIILSDGTIPPGNRYVSIYGN